MKDARQIENISASELNPLLSKLSISVCKHEKRLRVRTGYIKQPSLVGRSVWKFLELACKYRRHSCGLYSRTTSVKILLYRPPAQLISDNVFCQLVLNLLLYRRLRLFQTWPGGPGVYFNPAVY